jgi:hypothetical protein
VRHSDPFPIGPLREGLCVDDHFVLMVAPKRQLVLPSGDDVDLMCGSHDAYVAANVPHALVKDWFSRPAGPDEPPPQLMTKLLLRWGLKSEATKGHVVLHKPREDNCLISHAKLKVNH